MAVTIKGQEDRILNFLPMDTKHAVVFVNLCGHLKESAAILKNVQDNFKGRITVVCFNLGPPEYFNCLDRAKVKTSEDYLTKEDYEYIDRYAIGLTRNWYLPKDKNVKGITECDGIHLGSIVEFDFQIFLVCRIKAVEVINRALTIEQPDRVVVMEDSDELSSAAKIIAKNFGVPVLIFNHESGRIILLKERLRSKISDLLYHTAIDRIARLLLRINKKAPTVVIDPRAYDMFTGPHQLKDYTFCLAEKGMPVRQSIFKRKRSYISFDAPLAYGLKRRVRNSAKEFAGKWRNLNNDAVFKGIFKYKDIVIWDLVYPKLMLFFVERFPRILKIISNVKEFHRRGRISAIVLRADGREAEKAVIFTARKLGIPTYYITHGVLGENNGHDILYCDKTVVWGKADFDRYISLGNAADRLSITGSPKYDILSFREKGGARESVYGKLNLDKNKEIIVFATQPIVRLSAYCTNDEHELILKAVLDAFRNIKDKYLVIKMHPFDNYALCQQVVDSSGIKDIIVVRDINIYDLIEASSLIITKSSTVGLEAMIFDKPVVTINLVKSGDEIPYAASRAALGVYGREALIPAIERIFNDEALKREMFFKRKEFVANYIFKLDGKSSERVVNLIKKDGG